jgi:hypothetical protein
MQAVRPRRKAVMLPCNPAPVRRDRGAPIGNFADFCHCQSPGSLGGDVRALRFVLGLAAG